MRTWISTAAVVTVMAVLTACSGTAPTQQNSSGKSGVEVFGTVDTGISRVK